MATNTRRICLSLSSGDVYRLKLGHQDYENDYAKNKIWDSIAELMHEITRRDTKTVTLHCRQQCSNQIRRRRFLMAQREHNREELFRRELKETIETSRLQQKVDVSAMKFKRFRSAFTTEQITFLEEQFKKCAYINNIQRKEISKILKIHERAVKVWFQNRRMKEKNTSSVQSVAVESKSVTLKQNENDDSHTELMMHYKPYANETKSRLDKVHITPKEKYKLCVSNSKVMPHASSPKHIEEPTVIEFEKQSPQPDEIGTPQVIDNTSKSYTKSNTYRSLSDESSAKFSIESCKKYTESADNRCDISVDKSKSKERNHMTSPQLQTTKHDLIFNSSTYGNSTLPQVLPTMSTSPSNLMIHPNRSNQEASLTTNTAYYVPHNLTPHFTQPPTPFENMIWKSINVLPFGSTGVPCATLTNNAGSLFVRSLENPPKSNCNCDCHSLAADTFTKPQGAPEPQYIITAIPYHYPGVSSTLNASSSLIL